MNQNPIEKLVSALCKLPGIGEKTATRLAFFILRSPSSVAQEIADGILTVRKQIRFCKSCQNLTEKDQCSICSNPERDLQTVCVVEGPSDVTALERSGVFRGTYHILHGAIAPLDGIGPEQLKVQELVNRVRESQVKEVILATGSNMEGEATALHIKEVLADSKVPITRIASGIPVGADLEYTDSLTLSRALEARRSYQ